MRLLIVVLLMIYNNIVCTVIVYSVRYKHKLSTIIEFSRRNDGYKYIIFTIYKIL